MVATIKLGSQGLEVSKIGFGCMGITAFYGPPMKDEDALKLLETVYASGCTHFDTAEVYRSGNAFEPPTAETQYNETIVGKFVQTVPRNSFTLATKFMPRLHNKYDLATVEKALDESLARLGLDFVDVYYLHRMPETQEQLKEWMSSVAQLVRKGKVKYVGLSESSPEWLRVAHAVHPVSVVQQEWSLLTRSPIEDVLVPACVELGVGIVAYSPLARNLLAEQKEAPKDVRANHPRFSPENFEKNQKLTAQITELGKTKNASASELSLAWLYQRAKELGVEMIAIPGSTKIANALSNIRSLQISLDDLEMKTLGDLGALTAGVRNTESALKSNMEGQLGGSSASTHTNETKTTGHHTASQVSGSSVKLGSQGLEVSQIGFGAMGITAFYGPPMKDEDALKLLETVYSNGCTHFDTAEGYRTGVPFTPPTADTQFNEVILGKFLKTVPRNSFTVATKFAPAKTMHPNGVEDIEQALNESLARLGLDYVDLYYLHRMPETIEELRSWMTNAAKLVKQGKIKYVGLSEVSPEWLREAHAIFPVSVIQQEWSLLTRSPIEDMLVPVCKELNIGIVAYSPLARNLLSEQKEAPKDWRSSNPRYSPENFEKNQKLTAQIAELGKTKGASASELSLAWLYHRAKELGVNMIAIPGTTKSANALSNIRAPTISLSESDMKIMHDLGALTAGARGDEAYLVRAVEGHLARSKDGADAHSGHTASLSSSSAAASSSSSAFTTSDLSHPAHHMHGEHPHSVHTHPAHYQSDDHHHDKHHHDKHHHDKHHHDKHHHSSHSDNEHSKDSEHHTHSHTGHHILSGLHTAAHTESHSSKHDDHHSSKHDHHSSKHDDHHSSKHDDHHSSKHDDHHSSKHDDRSSKHGHTDAATTFVASSSTTAGTVEGEAPVDPTLVCVLRPAGHKDQASESHSDSHAHDKHHSSHHGSKHGEHKEDHVVRMHTRAEDYIVLNTGAHMPLVGFGTYQCEPGKVGECVETALKAGYRHIDCAEIYGNHKEIGVAFHKIFSNPDSGIKREDVFITSKLWTTDFGPSAVRPALEKALKELQLEYLDLYLMHVPVPMSKQGAKGVATKRAGFCLIDTWRMLEGLHKEGLAKAIGVSNFPAILINDFQNGAAVVPAVNQIERHPYLQQEELVEFHRSLGIALTAFSPLGAPGEKGDKLKHIEPPLQHPIIVEIARKYSKTPAQVLIRWSIDAGIPVIPKSSTTARIHENFAVFDFHLDSEDLHKIADLDRNLRLFEQSDEGVPCFK